MLSVVTEKTCHWERCTEPARNVARWRREAADGRNDVYDYAHYCDGHMMKATTQGAVCIERNTQQEEPVSSIPPAPQVPLWRRALQARGQK
jgi:hypothetical protein